MDKKISWSFFSMLIGVFLFIVGGSFAYTGKTAGTSQTQIEALRVQIKHENDLQDKRVDELRGDIKELAGDVKMATEAILAHRAYTEGLDFDKKGLKFNGKNKKKINKLPLPMK